MNLMKMLRTLAALFFGGVALWIVVLNWYALLMRVMTRRGPSWIPLVGALFAVAAVFSEASGVWRRYWWIAFLADAGSLPGLLVTLAFCLRNRRYGP